MFAESSLIIKPTRSEIFVPLFQLNFQMLNFGAIHIIRNKGTSHCRSLKDI